MDFLDYNEEVRFISVDGTTHRAIIDGFVEQISPGAAELGHGELLLSHQRWVNVTLNFFEGLNVSKGTILFTDRSTSDVELQKIETSQSGHFYKVRFNAHE